MNLKILKKGRPRLKPGDIFVFQIKEGEFGFGKVIRTDVHIGIGLDIPEGGGKCVLVYIYEAISHDKNNIPVLRKEDLLIPPDLINRLPWSSGYLENVGHGELKPEDVFNPHCFYRAFDNKYYDDYNHELPIPIHPVGTYGLGSFRTLDDKISEALGIKLPEN